MRLRSGPTALSLFSGAMGLDLGLERSGVNIVGCVENDAAAVRTIRHNKPLLPVIGEDICSLDATDCLNQFGIGSVDLVVGGPPCQAFSVFGKRLGTRDPRGQLIFQYQRFIRDLRPSAFVLENVRGLLSMRSSPDAAPGSLFEQLLAGFIEEGYRVDTYVVNAVNYGAPQISERLIVIGNRLGVHASFPEPTHSDRASDGLLPFETLGSALGNRIDPDPTIMDFSARKKRYLELVPPGGNWRSLPVEIQMESMGKSWHLKGGRSAYWRRLSWDAPCPTVVTMPNHAGTSMCHPFEVRALTVGECAIIQGFPEQWQFLGSPSDRYKQIGNAVPVILGAMAGQAVMHVLNGERESTHPAKTITHLRPHVRTRQYWKGGRAFVGSPYGTPSQPVLSL